MFLRTLDRYQKLHFWSLVNLVAKCDGEVSSGEADVINDYRLEMNEENLEVIIHDINEALSFFASCPPQTRRVVFVEVAALVMADSRYSDAEKAVIDRMAVMFGISDDHKHEFFAWIRDMQDLYARVYQLVG